MKYNFSLFRVFTDSATNKIGNTSPVIVLDEPLSQEKMQAIATDLWQPATTFLWKEREQWQARWFAPDQEISLCGHGSLAAVAQLELLGHSEIQFSSKGGLIAGGSAGNQCFIDLDSIKVSGEIEENRLWEGALGIPVIGHYETNNKNIILTDTEESVLKMIPDFSQLRSSPIFGYTVTAKGNEVDFVSRTLVPHVHQLEDPATGSSHAALAPFWNSRLGKKKMTAYQLSKRGGKFDIEMVGDKVRLTGDYQKFGEGTVSV